MIYGMVAVRQVLRFISIPTGRDKFCFCLFLLYFYSWNCYSQTYRFDNYSVEDGLAQSQILAICQDKQGNIWFGTNGGLSKFNGEKFTTYDENNGLVNNQIRSIILTAEAEGKLWIGTTNGVSIYNGFYFKNYTTKDGLTNNTIFELFEDTQGKIWLGTKKGVCIYENNKFYPFNKDSLLDESMVIKIYEDSKKNLWFGTLNNGVFIYNVNSNVPANGVINLSTKDGLNDNNIRTIIEDKDGVVWIGTDKGLSQCKKTNLSDPDDSNYTITRVQLIEKEYGEKGIISYTSSLIDKDGVLWFGTFSGLVCLKIVNTRPVIKRYVEKNGLIFNKIWEILEDREGNIWLGTNGGVSVFKGEAFVNFSKRNNVIPADNITALYHTVDGVWIGLTDKGVIKLSTQEIDTIFSSGYLDRPIHYKSFFYDITTPNKNMIAGSNVYSIIQDSDANLWFGTNQGISKYDGKRFYKFNVSNIKTENTVYSILEDKRKNIWFGTKIGIFKLDGDSLFPLQEINKYNTGIVLSIFEDAQSNIWFATENGAFLYDGKIVKHFSEKDGFIDGKVRIIRQLADKNFWFSTVKGLYKYDGKKFDFVSEKYEEIPTNIFIMLTDIDDNLWLGTNKGVYKLDIIEYNKTGKLNIKHYGKNEGFFGVECNFNAGCKDNEGRLWFGTIEGVTIVNPELLKNNTVEPITTITNLKLNFENYDWTVYSEGIDSVTGLPKNLILPYNKNHLTFEFIGISHTVPEKVRYQYMLEGLDEKWSPVLSKNDATYPKLPPGNYVFKVKSCNSDGIWNTKPTEFYLKIRPPFWQTAWFYVSVVIFIITLIYLIFKIRTRNLIKQKKLLEELVDIRTIELREEKEKVEKINVELVKQKELVEEKNKNITSSITYAKRIQTALLTEDKLIKSILPESFILYMPRDIVSGDFYWFSEIDGKTIIAAVDCTGHGVPGAFMSILGNSFLNEIVNEKNITKPSEILDILREMVIASLKQKEEEGEAKTSFVSASAVKDGMDIAIVSITPNPSPNGREDMRDGYTIEFAGANNPLWLVTHPLNSPSLPVERATGGELQELKPDKMPIGIHITKSKRPFTNHTIKAQKGDTIYLFTDGYIDQLGGQKGKKILSKGFKEILLSIQDKNMQEQQKFLSDYIKNWMGTSYEQVDDILIIGVRI